MLSKSIPLCSAIRRAEGLGLASADGCGTGGEDSAGGSIAFALVGGFDSSDLLASATAAALEFSTMPRISPS